MSGLWLVQNQGRVILANGRTPSFDEQSQRDPYNYH